MTPGEQYKLVQKQVSDIALSCGRPTDSVTVVAISKNYGLPQVLSAYQAGCICFGESRVQEALPKIAAAPADIQWHFVGTLQKNKVNHILGKFVMIHSVDSPDLAHKISEASSKAGIVTHILLQANTSGEASKHGLTDADWERFFPPVWNLPGIRIEGLMTMAPLTEDREVIRTCFRRLRELRDRLKGTIGDATMLPHLSMGMSNDFPIAIEEGATLVRIGRAIFG